VRCHPNPFIHLAVELNKWTGARARGPVLSAFISGSALIIVSEQCKHLLGVSFPRQTQFYGTLHQLLVHLVDTHLPTLAVAAGTLALLFLCKKLKQRLPFLEGPAILVTLGIVCAWFFDWEGTGMKLVGPIPSGLPALSLPLPSSDGGDGGGGGGKFSVLQMLNVYLQSILEILPAALALVLVSCVEPLFLLFFPVHPLAHDGGAGAAT